MDIAQKIQERLDLLRAQQMDIKEAIAARIGEHGETWVKAVMAAACTCAVLQHYHDESDTQELKNEFQFAVTCVLCCQAVYLMECFSKIAPEMCKRVGEEFDADVRSIVLKCSSKISIHDLTEDE